MERLIELSGSRRLGLWIIAGLLAVTSPALADEAAASPVSTSASADWPGFLGPRRDGSYAGRIDVDWPEQGPSLVWSIPVGRGDAGPIVVDGRVLLFHRVEEDWVLEARSVADGSPLWRRAQPAAGRGRSGPLATPLAVGSRLLTLAPQGRLQSWSLEDGALQWTVETLERFDGDRGFFGVGASPLVVGETVILNVGGKRGGIVGLDVASGATRWTATDHGSSYASPRPFQVDGVLRVLVWTRQGLVELDPRDGRVGATFRWRSRMDASVNAATPVLVGDAVFLTASYSTGAVLLRRSRRDGCPADAAGRDPGEAAGVQGSEPAPPERCVVWEPAWSTREALSAHYNTPVHLDGVLYGIDGRQEGRPSFRALRAEDGSVAWSIEDFGTAHLLRAGRTLLALREDGALWAVAADPERPRVLAEAQPLDGGARAVPALAGGLLFARDRSRLVAIDLRPQIPPDPR